MVLNQAKYISWFQCELQFRFLSFPYHGEKPVAVHNLWRNTNNVVFFFWLQKIKLNFNWGLVKNIYPFVPNLISAQQLNNVNFVPVQLM